MEKIKYKIPTEEEINAIPNENLIAWLRAEYNHDCCEPDYISVTTNKEEMEKKYRQFDYMISFKTFCTGLNQTYCDVTPEQYEKIKAGFYNNDLEDKEEDRLKMVKFMGYIKKYPDDEKIFFKKVDVDEDDEDWIWLKGGKTYEFRPNIKWEDLNKVIDHIESKPSTLMTSIEYLDSDRYTYSFKIVMQNGVTAEGLTSGTSKESKIDAAYKGVMNYINWRNKLEEDGKD